MAGFATVLPESPPIQLVSSASDQVKLSVHRILRLNRSSTKKDTPCRIKSCQATIPACYLHFGLPLALVGQAVAAGLFSGGGLFEVETGVGVQ